MENIQLFVQEYRIWLAAAAIVVFMFKPAKDLALKAYAAIKTKAKSVSSKVESEDTVDPELNDYISLRHLRDRSKEFGDTEMTTLLKEVSNRLFDHYA